MAKRYRVTGGRRVLDHEPGDEFVATLDEAQEERLKNAGHIRVVEDHPYAKKDDNKKQKEE